MVSGRCAADRSHRARGDPVTYRSSNLTVAWITFLVAVRLAADEPEYYSIKMDDHLIGYSVTVRQPVESDGRLLSRLKSETFLKVALLGQQRRIQLDSETWVQPDTSRPVRYRVAETTNEAARQIDCEFSGDTVRTWIYQVGDPRGESVDSKLPAGTLILGGNIFAHWQLILRAASDNASSDKASPDTAKLSVYLPDSRQVDSFQLTRGNPLEVALAGGSRRCVPWHVEPAKINLPSVPTT